VISSNSSTENTGEAVPETASIPERVVPDPAARPVRRSFTAAYRLAIVAGYESPRVGEGCGATQGGPVSLAHQGVDRSPRRRGAIAAG